MKNRYFMLIAAAFFLFCCGEAFAVDRYMATTGVNAGNCSDSANPCLTLQYAMSKMAGGDTLFIDDGNYTSSANRLDQNNRPPSGSAGAFTTIRAKNIPCQSGVPCDQPLKVRFSGSAMFEANGPGSGASSYVKFWGIRWDGIQTYVGWNHLYFKQVASQGVQDGNTASISINGQYNLLEDVIAFGKGRYKILFYDPSRESQSNGPGHNLCRRCVIRHDWAKKNDTSPDPIAGIASYFNRATACLNCVVIDSDTPSEWMDDPTELSGAFYQPVDSGAHAFIIKGSMVINTAMAVYYNRTGSTGHVIQDLAAAKVAGGLGLQGSTDVNRVTLLDIGRNNFTYRSTTQSGTVLAPNDGILSYAGTQTVNNAIIRDAAGKGINGDVNSDYINLFSITGTSYTGTAPPHLFTTDPLLNGLKYLPRIEDGSTLGTEGSGGGQVGARIVNKLGVDGTFKNDTGWDTEQSEGLWPWPHEDWIRAEMKTSEYTSDANRGFCAAGQSFTNYIWGYLGNTIIPPLGMEGLVRDGKATLIWDKPLNTATLTGFKIYNVTSGTQVLAATVSGSETFHKVMTGLTNNATYKFVVTAIDSVKGESGPSSIITVVPKAVAPMPPITPGVK